MEPVQAEKYTQPNKKELEVCAKKVVEHMKEVE